MAISVHDLGATIEIIIVEVKRMSKIKAKKGSQNPGIRHTCVRDH